MTLTADQAAAFAAHVFSAAGAWYLDPSSDAVRVASTVLRGLPFLLPSAAPAVTALEGAADAITQRSAVLPGPTGPVVIVGESDRADPARFAEASVSLAARAAAMARAGGVQSVVDYLGSGELRAVHEAVEWSARGFVRHLLTGVAMSPAALATELRADVLLPIDDHEATMARGILASTAATVAEGLCPPIAACSAALAWLRTNAPDSIATESFKVAA